ncbi:FecR family protein [Formosa sp. S-31]|uniref:FecR family protein n=1 Tax=Formosa sp. S-31 TaxID=2790949 RepID=UPI003EC0462B
MDIKKRDIQVLILEYATQEISQENLQVLKDWISKSKENEIFFIENLQIYKRSRQLGLSRKLNKDKAWKHIVSQLQTPLNINTKQKSKSGVFMLPNKFLYYAAAVLVVALLSAPFLVAKKNVIETNITEQNINSIILPGSDQARLTLGDGEEVVLGKGTSFNKNNIHSSGTALVYDKETGLEDLVFNYLTIPTGGQFYLELSDGTKVWLNSETQLKYPETFSNEEPRTVELVYGEAYFEVFKDEQKPFIVNTQYGNVKVLGTHFNISAYEDEIDFITTLIEGKVQVNIQETDLEGNSEKNIVLHPNQQVFYNENLSQKYSVTAVDAKIYSSWKDGSFYFDDESLDNILRKMSRWYNFDVRFKDETLKTKRFKGMVMKDKTLNYLLDIISQTAEIKYKITVKNNRNEVEIY